MSEEVKEINAITTDIEGRLSALRKSKKDIVVPNLKVEKID
jgi:hypothetical protein